MRSALSQKSDADAFGEGDKSQFPQDGETSDLHRSAAKRGGLLTPDAPFSSAFSPSGMTDRPASALTADQMSFRPGAFRTPDGRLIVPEGPVLTGSLRGVPQPQDAHGGVQVYGKNGEFWLHVSSPKFYNIPRGLYSRTFVFLCPSKHPGMKLPASGCVQLSVPGTNANGSIPTPPSESRLDALESLPDWRFSLADVHLYEDDNDTLVDPRDFGCLIIATPDEKNDNGDVLTPSRIYAYAPLNIAGHSKEDRSAQNAALIRRSDLSLETEILSRAVAGSEELTSQIVKAASELHQDLLQPTDIKGKSYFELEAIAEDCFSVLGKNKQTGSLTFSDFKTLLGNLSISHTEARAWLWFDTADEDGNGTLEFYEFVHLLCIVGHAKPAPYLTLRDVYYFFSVDRQKEADEAAKAELEFRKGTPGARPPSLPSGVREELPLIDILALEAILTAFHNEGIRINSQQVATQFRLADARTNRAMLDYRQVQRIFVGLVDPRAELAKRGSSIAALLADYLIPNDNKETLQSYLITTMDKEDQMMIENLKDAMDVADSMREEFHRELMRKQLENETGDKKDDKVERRIRALRLREERLRRAREVDAEKERAKRQEEIREELEKAENKRKEIAKAQEEETSAMDLFTNQAKLSQFELDKLELGGRGLQCLPKMMWTSEIGKTRLANLIILDLSQNALVVLPGKSFLACCPKLQKLNVAGNLLKELPDDIGLLEDLLILNAESNVLTSLPYTLGNLYNLRTLTAHGNKISELYGESFEHLTSLETLTLQGNQIKELPPQIGNLRKLRVLNLARNKLSYLPNEVGNLKRLGRIDLRANTLQELPVAFTNLKHLTHLLLAHNYFRRLPDDIDKLKKLMFLDIARNRIKILPNSLGKLKHLLYMDASENSIALLPPKVFENMRDLQRLDLSRNKIDVLPMLLDNLLNLQALNLSRNRIRFLPDTIRFCINLRHLDMSFNALGMHGHGAIPSSVRELHHLEWLDLSFNNLEEVAIDIALCQSLRYLNLSNNKMKELHPALAILPKVETLDLSYNELAKISSAIGKCRSLRALDLSCNRLTHLPSSIAECEALIHLHCYNNSLITLPFSIAWLVPQLISFDVGRNPLKGLPHKWSAQEVAGAADVLGLRFTRERKEPLLVTIRRVRARELTRQLLGLQEEREDVRDRERILMLREDTRILKKSPIEIVQEVAGFAGRRGWTRAPRGMEPDRLSEWIAFMAVELRLDDHEERIRRAKQREQEIQRQKLERIMEQQEMDEKFGSKPPTPSYSRPGDAFLSPASTSGAHDAFSPPSTVQPTRSGSAATGSAQYNAGGNPIHLFGTENLDLGDSNREFQQTLRTRFAPLPKWSGWEAESAKTTSTKRRLRIESSNRLKMTSPLKIPSKLEMQRRQHFLNRDRAIPLIDRTPGARVYRGRNLSAPHIQWRPRGDSSSSSTSHTSARSLSALSFSRVSTADANSVTGIRDFDPMKYARNKVKAPGNLIKNIPDGQFANYAAIFVATGLIPSEYLGTSSEVPRPKIFGTDEARIVQIQGKTSPLFEDMSSPTYTEVNLGSDDERQLYGSWNYDSGSDHYSASESPARSLDGTATRKRKHARHRHMYEARQKQIAESRAKAEAVFGPGSSFAFESGSLHTMDQPSVGMDGVNIYQFSSALPQAEVVSDTETHINEGNGANPMESLKPSRALEPQHQRTQPVSSPMTMSPSNTFRPDSNGFVPLAAQVSNSRRNDDYNTFAIPELPGAQTDDAAWMQKVYHRSNTSDGAPNTSGGIDFDLRPSTEANARPNSRGSVLSNSQKESTRVMALAMLPPWLASSVGVDGGLLQEAMSGGKIVGSNLDKDTINYMSAPITPRRSRETDVAEPNKRIFAALDDVPQGRASTPGSASQGTARYEMGRKQAERQARELHATGKPITRRMSKVLGESLAAEGIGVGPNSVRETASTSGPQPSQLPPVERTGIATSGFFEPETGQNAASTDLVEYVPIKLFQHPVARNAGIVNLPVEGVVKYTSSELGQLRRKLGKLAISSLSEEPSDESYMRLKALSFGIDPAQQTGAKGGSSFDVTNKLLEPGRLLSDEPKRILPGSQSILASVTQTDAEVLNESRKRQAALIHYAKIGTRRRASLEPQRTSSFKNFAEQNNLVAKNIKRGRTKERTTNHSRPSSAPSNVEALNSILKEVHTFGEGEINVVGKLSAVNIRRLRALAKEASSRVADLLARDPTKFDAAMNKQLLSDARTRARREHVSMMLNQMGLDEQGEPLSALDDRLFENFEKPGGNTAARFTGRRDDGLYVETRLRTAIAEDRDVSKEAVNAYNDLLASGVIFQMHKSKAARAEAEQKARSDIIQSQLREKAKEKGLELSQSLVSMDYAVEQTMESELSQYSFAKSAADLLFSRAKAAAEARRKAIFEARDEGIPAAAKVAESKIVTQPGHYNEEGELIKDPFKYGVGNSFLSTKTTDGKNDPRRDPASFIREDPYDVTYTILQASHKGVKPHMKGFGDGLFKKLWTSSAKMNPTVVRGVTFFDAETPEEKAARKEGDEPPELQRVQLPHPEDVTGINLQPTKRGEEPPASESIQERRFLHEKRLKEAAKNVRLYQYVGGVRFVDDEEDEQALLEDQEMRNFNPGAHSIVPTSPGSAASGRAGSADGSAIAGSEDSAYMPTLPYAVIRRTDPFGVETKEPITTSTIRPIATAMEIMNDKGDHNRHPGPDQLHIPSSFTRGYNSSEIAEYLRLEAIFAPAAEAEWLERAGSYIESRLTAHDFVRCVRRRMQGKDPITGLLETELFNAPMDESQDNSGTSMWDPVLIPLIHRYFNSCYKTGLPPLYGHPTPEQAEARNATEKIVREYRAKRSVQLEKMLAEQWHAYHKLYSITPDELQQKVADAKRKALERKIQNSATNHSIMMREVAKRNARQEKLSRQREQMRQEENRELAELAVQKAQEKDNEIKQAAERAGLNSDAILGKRARGLLTAMSLMHSGVEL